MKALIKKGCAVRTCWKCGNPVILRRGVIDPHQSQGSECSMSGMVHPAAQDPAKG